MEEKVPLFGFLVDADAKEASEVCMTTEFVQPMVLVVAYLLLLKLLFDLLCFSFLVN
jgi:hypothetical protein